MPNFTTEEPSGSLMPPEDQIVRSTVRLEFSDGSGRSSFGTGFFYQVQATAGPDAPSKVLIITNKHVVGESKRLKIRLTTGTSVNEVNARREPIGRQDQDIETDLVGRIFDHPNSQVDLCGIDVTDHFAAIMSKGRKVRAAILNSTWLLSQVDRGLVRDIEQTLVVGYPNTQWDPVNNMPIARRGASATHPLAYYEGTSRFLVDVAAYPGSSGSPVFLYQSPMYRSGVASQTPGTKINLIGIVYAVFTRDERGRMEPIEIPTVVA
jgi:S1-C subfamily serine protease